MPTIVRSPTGDGDFSASVSVFPASPTTKWDKVDEYPTPDDDSTYLYFAGTGSFYFTFPAISIPSYATGISVKITYRHKKIASQTCSIRSAMKVGGAYYTSVDGGVNPTNGSWNDREFTYSVNPRTGVAWTPNDINGIGANALQQIGLTSTDATPNPYITQYFMTIDYDQNVNAQAGGWNAEAAGGAPKKSVALQAFALAAAIAAGSATIVSAGGQDVFASAGSWAAGIAGAESARTRAADAGAWESAIAAGDPSKTIGATAGSWNQAFADGLAKRAREAIAAAQAAGIAGAEASRTREGSAAGSNQAIAAGLGTIEAAGVVFATAGGWNSGIAGAEGARDREASAAGTNAGASGADPSRIREASAAGFDRGLAGASSGRIREASAAGSNAGQAGARASLSRIISAAAAGFNRAIGGALAILTRYIPAAIERDVQPRIREAAVEYDPTAHVDPRIREAHVVFEADEAINYEANVKGVEIK